MSYIFVLDPGHQNIPNPDTGCSGFNLHEEDIVLDICKRAKPLVESNGIQVIMTRDGATVNGDGSSLNASLNTRCQIANNSHADLFLSVHCDAFNSQAYGTTVHVFGLGGNAEKFAKILNPLMGQLFYNRGIKASNFQVLRNTDMPAALLETAFLDNQNDNAKLANPDIRQQIAVNIAKSVCDYFGIQYKEQNQGGNSKVKTGVLLYTKDDAVTGFRIAEKFNNCAVFVRKDDKTASSEVMNCETLYIVGGQSVGHPNEVILSGVSWWETVVNAKAKLGF